MGCLLMPAADSLAYFGYRRTALLRVLRSLADAQWSRTVREAGKQRREPVYRLARGMALHEAGHVAWLATRLAGSGT